MLPEKSNLVLHTIFKSATSIDIEVTDRVVFHFCKSSKNLGSLFKRFKRDPRIIITDLEEDRTSDMACIFDRPVFIPPDNDPGTGFVHITFWHEPCEGIIRIWGIHKGNRARFSYNGDLMRR